MAKELCPNGLERNENDLKIQDRYCEEDVELKSIIEVVKQNQG